MNPRHRPPLIRPGGPEDIPGVAHVHLATRRSAYVRLLPAPVLADMTEAGLARWWQRRLNTTSDPHQLLVAVDGEPGAAVLGFAHLGPGDAGIGELYAIHVHPDTQGMGLGARLLNKAVVALHGLGYRRVELWVLDGNRRAQGFYRRHGWHLVEGLGREEEIDGVAVTEVAYRRDLP